MNTLIKKFLLLTLSIEGICWGLLVILGQYHISFNDYPILMIPYILGGLSPTIASYIALKKSGKIDGIKDWLGTIFDVKQSIWKYLLVCVLAIIYILPHIIVNGYEAGEPLIMLLPMLCMMLIGGGMEEAGWRYVLQPELEKKYSFTVATLIVAAIWWLWHAPLFIIPGVTQYGKNYIAFGISILGLTFAMAIVRRVTNSVWLCVLLHCLINALPAIFIIKDSIIGNTVTTVIYMGVAYLLLIFVRKNKQKYSVT